MANEKYEFIADQIGQFFLKAWAISTTDVESDVVDYLAMFCMCDGI